MRLPAWVGRVVKADLHGAGRADRRVRLGMFPIIPSLFCSLAHSQRLRSGLYSMSAYDPMSCFDLWLIRTMRGLSEPKELITH